jgi:two-component SAPR family response regulator
LLALRREGAQRDEILEALWPGEDPERSRHSLYQAVRDARRLLGDAVASERDRYWLDRSRSRVDIDALRRLLDEASRADADHRLQLLENALALFRDEPLAGSDFRWAEGEVRRLRGAYIELLEEVGRANLEAGAGREALDAAERGLAVDVLNEGLWRLAMHAESELGLRDSVARRYEALRIMLDRRLVLEPARETRALYLKLLGQE